MTIYITTPISQPPKEDGWYTVTIPTEKGIDVFWWYDSENGWQVPESQYAYTHYLRQVEGNVLTDEELEAVWQAGWGNGHADGADLSAHIIHPDKDTYLKSIKK